MGWIERDDEEQGEGMALSDLENVLRQAELLVNRVFPADSDLRTAAFALIAAELLDYYYTDDITNGEWEP